MLNVLNIQLVRLDMQHYKIGADILIRHCQFRFAGSRLENVVNRIVVQLSLWFRPIQSTFNFTITMKSQLNFIGNGLILSKTWTKFLAQIYWASVSGIPLRKPPFICDVAHFRLRNRWKEQIHIEPSKNALSSFAWSFANNKRTLAYTLMLV